MSANNSGPETLAEYVAFQDGLVQEAAEALPHQFSQCTYPLGYIRQAVYLCLTCPEARGICSACSIACHTDHEQMELFPKRDFRCDCPTQAIAHPCSLQATNEPFNSLNRYGQNFQGLFCRCKRPYDAATEKETMIQCLACEDWFHESCCNLRERPNSDLPTDNKDQDSNGDAASEAPTDLPPPLIGPEDYDAFVCSGCVLHTTILQKYAGTRGCSIVLRDNPTSPWKVVQGIQIDHDDLLEVSLVPESSIPLNGNKRALSPTGIDSNVKRPRLSPSSRLPVVDCLAPTLNVMAQKMIADLTSMTDPSLTLGTGDVFLTEGFRDRWCRCSSCFSELEAHPYLLKEEETYEPPEDPDSALSLEELGMRALSRLPRERAIDGIHAFNTMRDDLVQYLRPFAQEGRVVNEEDVRDFFDRLLEQKRAFKEHQS